MTTETETKCCDCGEAVDTEQEYYWSSVQEDYLCSGCHESDGNSCATVQIVTDDSVERYYIGKHIRMTEYGDDIGWAQDTPLKFTNEWVSTDAWRGYSETKIVGWSTIVDGWTTGGWDDYVARKKQVFNQWAEALLTQELFAPTPVAIITEPTSNVFSTAVTIQVPADAEQEFREWLNSQDVTLEQLEDALS
jgi:hypothetical protein